jgi:hypothetical protein
MDSITFQKTKNINRPQPPISKPVAVMGLRHPLLRHKAIPIVPLPVHQRAAHLPHSLPRGPFLPENEQTTALQQALTLSNQPIQNPQPQQPQKLTAHSLRVTRAHPKDPPLVSPHPLNPVHPRILPQGGHLAVAILARRIHPRLSRPAKIIPPARPLNVELQAQAQAAVLDLHGLAHGGDCRGEGLHGGGRPAGDDSVYDEAGDVFEEGGRRGGAGALAGEVGVGCHVLCCLEV